MAITRGVNAGFVLVAPINDPLGQGVGVDGSALVTKDTSPAFAFKITEIGWWTGSATEETNFEVGLYAADGVDVPGEAHTLLYSNITNAKGTTAGWKRVTVDWNIDANTPYWLAVQLDDTATTTFLDMSGTGGDGRDSYVASSLENPYGASAAYDPGAIAIYAVYAATTYSSNILCNSRIKLNNLSNTVLLNAKVKTIETYSSDNLLNARISIPYSNENLLNSTIKINYNNEIKTIARIKIPSNSEISSNSRIKIPYNSDNILSSRIELKDQSSEVISSARIQKESHSENILNAKVSGIYASLNLVNARIKLLGEADEILLNSKTILHNFSQQLINSRILKELNEENQLQARIKIESESENLLLSRIKKELSSENLVSARIKKQFSEEELFNSRIQIESNSENLLNSKIQLNYSSENLLNASIAALGFSDNLLNSYVFLGYQDDLSCNARIVFNPKIKRVQDSIGADTRNLDETSRTEPARIGGDRIFPTR